MSIDSTNQRQWMVPGALVAAVGGALSLAICNAMVNFAPGFGSVGDSTEDYIRHVADNAALTQMSSAVGLLAALLLVPGTWAVASRLAPMSPRLAAIGGWMMGSGYIFFIVLSIESLSMVSLAEVDGGTAILAEATDNHTSPVMYLLYGVFGLGALGGGLVLGIAMLRQNGGVPSWAGWAMIASEPVRVLGLILGVPFGPPLASILIAVAFGGTIVATASARRTESPSPVVR